MYQHQHNTAALAVTATKELNKLKGIKNKKSPVQISMGEKRRENSSNREVKIKQQRCVATVRDACNAGKCKHGWIYLNKNTLNEQCEELNNDFGMALFTPGADRLVRNFSG